MQPETLDTVLTVTFIVSIPCCAAVIYVMNKMTWDNNLRRMSYLFHAAVIHTQLVMTKLAPAVFFAPESWGYIGGWLADAPIWISATVYISSIPTIPMISCMILYYRQQALLPLGSKLKLNFSQNIVLWIYLTVAVLILPTVFCILMNYKNEAAAVELLPTMPAALQARFRVHPNSVFAYLPDNIFWKTGVIVYAIAITSCCVFGISVWVAFEKVFKQFGQVASERTRKMQESFSRIMVIQVFMVIFCIGVSEMALLLPVIFKITWLPEEMNLISCLIMAQIGPGMLLMVMAGSPESRRQLVFGIIKGVTGREMSTASTVTVAPSMF